MKRAGVIGWPVDHSLSPVLHGYWLKQYGIEGSYEKIPAAPEDFTSTIQRLRDEGFSGVNCTVPHKEAAFALADERKLAAKISGAVNLLVFRENGVEGHNTDGFGLQHSLREGLHGDLVGKKAVLLGAGGAARGGILALNALRAEEIYILNRHPDRAKSLALELENALRDVQEPHHTCTPKMIGSGFEDWKRVAQDAELLVNTTSAGMSGNLPLELDLAALPPAAAVCDIVYNPLETDLLKRAKARGHRTIDGLGMLMYQAAPSFEAFFGTFPHVDNGLRAALVDALAHRT